MSTLPTTVAFLTVIDCEYEAVLAYLRDKKLQIINDKINDRVYAISRISQWRIVVRQQSAQGNYQSARETEWLIQYFKPDYLFLVGVAGGIKDVHLGDVVAATFVRGYEHVKIKDGQVFPRFNTEHSSASLIAIAENLADDVIDKSPENDKKWQSIAARNAATFAFSILNVLLEQTSSNSAQNVLTEAEEKLSLLELLKSGGDLECPNTKFSFSNRYSELQAITNSVHPLIVIDAPPFYGKTTLS